MVAESGAVPVTERKGKSAILWVLLWLFWLALLAQQTIAELRFNAPVQLLVIQALPLLVFMPGVARDNLRSVIWLTFVLLGYFVWAVLAAFARTDDLLAQSGVALIVALFAVAALYIRFRGRELKSASSANQKEENV
jgi:uncharacterized membrane protein